MRKSDLRTGMLVITRSNKKSIIMLNIDYLTNKDALVSNGINDEYTYMPLDRYHEDLTSKEGKDFDIIEIYSYSNNQQGLALNIKSRELLWKRNEDSIIILNKDYTAIVDKETKTVKVGCQVIPFDKVNDLYKMINKMINE